MPENPVTRAELWHATSQIESRIDQLSGRLERRLDNLQFVSKDAFAALEDRVEDLEEGKKWLTRTLFVAVTISFLMPLIVAWVVSQ